ncbi:MFS transporter [Streptomyces sp. NBC_01221]|uniref:MFS transporter n=1 Tax=Streptomyces sp. NBC_01221 TaxID=2903782 RepID=UPI002255A3F5|nr:MFS transporter [Streptomyces sp. NBC_01221]MCX4791878.1 MFS transporter [Streptomyces sp. NBC_01221]
MSETLRQNTAFRRFWIGDVASQFAAQTVTVGMPLVALELLDPTTFEMGLISSFATVAFLVVGLPAGVFVDRARQQRTVMISADVFRCALMAFLGISALSGHLGLTQVYATALLIGVFTVFFDVAQQSYVPRIVHADLLESGNARIAATQSVAQVAAPMVGGLLIAMIGAKALPMVLSCAFALSTVFLLRIQTREHGAESVKPERVRLGREIREGLAYVVRTPALRAITLCTGWFNLFALVVQSVITVRLVRDLGLTPAYAGIYFALGACGSVAGALTAQFWVRRFGSSTVIRRASLFTAPFALLIPVTSSSATFALAGLGYFLLVAGATVYNVAQLSRRQRICPPVLLGRMNASIRFLVWGTMPLGGLLGGAVGAEWSARTALMVGAVGMCLASLPLLVSSALRDSATASGPYGKPTSSADEEEVRS